MTTAIKNFISLVLVIAFFLMLVSTNAYADTIVGGIDWSSQAILGDTYDGSNGFSAAWLNGLYDLSDRNIATNRLDGRTYNATSRAGVFWPQENDNPLPSTNIGQEEDGLLNGENDGGNDGTYSYEHNDDINNIYNTMEYQFDGLEFISEQQLQDVDGLGANIDGRFDDDPGWIRLYKEDVDENGNTEESSYGSVKDTDGNVILEINDGDDNKVLDFEITKNGNNWEWSL